jgi:putative flippase GtrA
LNRAWSFAGRRRTRGQFVRHVIVYALAYPLTLGISWLLEQVVFAWLATALTIGIIAVAIFLAANRWIYPVERRTADRPRTAPTAP